MSFPVGAVLAGFAIGATSLQACAQLPPAPWALAIVASCATAAAGAFAVHVAAGARAAPTTRAVAAAPRATVTFAGTLALALAFAASASLGFCYAAGRADLRLADAMPVAWEDRDIRVTGVVDGLPHQGDNGARFAFAIERVLTPGATVPRRVSLAWFAQRASGDASSAPRPIVHAGERWTLMLRLKRPHGNVNPHGFDLEAWLLEHNLRATGYVRDDPRNVRVADFAGRPGDRVERARERIRDRIAAVLGDAPYRGVLVALAIGDQRAIPDGS